MRRLSILVLTLSLAFPLAARAGSAAEDPDGVSESAPASTAGDLVAAATPSWIESLVRVLLAQLGL